MLAVGGNLGRRDSALKRRVLLADDHCLFTEALTLALAERFQVEGCFPSGRDLLDAVAGCAADSVVLEISMPGMNGLETVRRIRAVRPEIGIVILAMHAERPYVDEAFRAGANAYIVKRDSLACLLEGIDSAIRGEQFVSPSAAMPSPGPVPASGAVLTPRQREILQLVTEGKSAKEIAAGLRISAKTVEYHKAAIMERVGLRTTAQLVRFALQNSLISG